MDPPAAAHMVRRLAHIVNASDLTNPKIPTRIPHAIEARSDLIPLFAELMGLISTMNRAQND
jgi:hypothetical protein